MSNFHPQLIKQLRASKINHAELPENIQSFLRSVDKLYNEVDQDREVLQRSIENSSKKMQLANDKLIEAVEDAKKSDEVKGQFLATMSHEIRTPIHGVLGLAEVLKQSPLNPEQDKYIGMILRSVQGLLGVVNDVLDYSKLQSGKLRIERKEFSIQELVEDTIELFSSAFRDRSIFFSSTIDPTLPKSIVSDGQRIRQILANLVGNSVKFTPPGGSVALEVRRISRSLDIDLVEISLSDNGIGIPEDKIKSIFEAFSQVDNTLTRKFEGTGLGLTICRQLLKLMRGDIWVESNEGKGSTFTFRIPLHEGVGNIEELPPLPINDTYVLEKRILEMGKISNEEPKGIRVLVSEDNQVNQKVISHILRRLGWEAIVVANGSDAVDAYHNKPFDLVLMDCQMPIMSGFDATKAIRAKEQQTGKHIPIIAMTALALDEDRKKCISAGMDDYISKPFGAHEVRIKLLEWGRRVTIQQV